MAVLIYLGLVLASTGLHSEQKALIDLLVLLKCRYFIGIVHSSYSYLVRELRAVHGSSRNTTMLLGGTMLDHVASVALLSR